MTTREKAMFVQGVMFGVVLAGAEDVAEALLYVVPVADALGLDWPDADNVALTDEIQTELDKGGYRPTHRGN